MSNTDKPKSPRGPTNVDKYVGMRIRLRRSLLEMSQSELGEKLGVTFQQVQKYERGSNRVGASRLLDLTKALEVSIEYFFKGLEEELSLELSSDDDVLPSFIASKLGPRFVIALSKIEDNEVLMRFLWLIEAAVGISHDGEDPD